MTTYTPDKWVRIEFTNTGTKNNKILGSWYGGYLGNDSYRLSSGITKVEDCKTYWRVINKSGSVYICHKEERGMSILAVSFMNMLKTKYPEIEFKICESI